MIEVVFNDSMKGSLKSAMNYNSEKMLNGPFAFVGEKPSEEELKKQFEGKPIGGSTADVIQFGFIMDIGSLSEDLYDETRIDLFKSTYIHFEDDAEVKEGQARSYFGKLNRDLATLNQGIIEGKAIRVWLSDSPHERCAYYALCHYLRHQDVELVVVEPPGVVTEDDNKMTVYKSWNEIEPGKLYKYLDCERKISTVEKVSNGNQWVSLIEENGDLRSIVCGQLMTVPIDFYDHLIYKYLTYEPKLMGRVIGELMGKNPIGVIDSWFADRIKHFIDLGHVKVAGVHDESHPYGLIIQLID